MEKSFTLSEIQRAFFENFHESGEYWFDYMGSPQENQDTTEYHWKEFKEKLIS